RLAHDIAGFKRESTAGKHVGKLLPQLLLKVRDRDACIGLKLDPQYRFLGTTRPQEDRIDRVRRRLSAHVAERHSHIVRACSFMNFIEDAKGHHFRRANSRSGWRTEPQLELSRIHPRKNLASHEW